MENPNPYDNAAFKHARSDTIAAVGAMFEAGASAQDIIDDVQSGLYDAGCEADMELDFKHIAAWVTAKAATR